MSGQDSTSQEVLHKRAGRLAARRRGGEANVADLKIAVFGVGKEHFGVEAHRVQQIVAMGKVRTLPGLPAGVMGVCAVRGELVSVVNTAKWLQIESQTTPHYLVVVQSELNGETVSLALTAERIEGFQELVRADLDVEPAARPDSVLQGTTRDLVSVLDVGRVFVDSRLVV